MNKNVQIVVDKQVERTINALEAHNMNGYFAKSKEDLLKILNDLVKDEQTVTVGGSMSLFETGVIDYLRDRNLNFLDRYQEGLSPEDIKKIYRDSFSADAYFTSTNAITEKGELYNVDGRGNRVAAMIYGPDKVIVVCGVNKIVKDLEEAKERNRRIAAPANVQRLSRQTPCHTTGYCTDCNSPDRICNIYTVIDKQFDKDRMHVIFVNEYLGY